MNVKLVYGVSLSLALMLTIQLAIAKAPIAKPNCTDHCGNINIPYPFGMGKGCYLGDWFEIECHNSVDRPPRAFISKIKTELLNISVLNPSLQAIDGNQSADGCKVAFLAGTYESYSRREKDSNVQFPMLLDWMVNSTLREDYFRMVIPETLDCDYSSSNELIFRCSCNSGYEGNPYLRCIDIDECKDQSIIVSGNEEMCEYFWVI
ncbi:hypothetical protein GH714_027005 [Hevea brasiliensis]|uniref:Uncharacterized protein n=1 Tax=Hevea brasiliensis TaxID=3981 RepID=A0A6A6LN81_HEVBR|nr:hypothetical protein GH714_027005 [Hevea brasiliensis]